MNLHRYQNETVEDFEKRLEESRSLEYWLEFDKKEIIELKRAYYDNMKTEQARLKLAIEYVEKRMERRKLEASRSPTKVIEN